MYYIILSIATCPDVKIKNGSTRELNFGGTFYVIASCNNNYELKGDRVRACKKGKWEGETPKCVAL